MGRGCFERCNPARASGVGSSGVEVAAAGTDEGEPGGVDLRLKFRSLAGAALNLTAQGLDFPLCGKFYVDLLEDVVKALPHNANQ